MRTGCYGSRYSHPIPSPYSPLINAPELLSVIWVLTPLSPSSESQNHTVWEAGSSQTFSVAFQHGHTSGGPFTQGRLGCGFQGMASCCIAQQLGHSQHSLWPNSLCKPESRRGTGLMAWLSQGTCRRSLYMTPGSESGWVAPVDSQAAGSTVHGTVAAGVPGRAERGFVWGGLNRMRLLL